MLPRTTGTLPPTIVATAPEVFQVARRRTPSARRKRAQIAAFEQRLRDDERYEPGPEEELAIGRCYQTVGDTAKARKWLQRAAADPATKQRARKALQTLPRK